MPDVQGAPGYACAIMFTGHMIDLPGRQPPRFPPELEPLAAREMARSLRRLKREFGANIIGLSSAARGGDIIFLEACAKLALAGFVVLPFSREQFAEASVAGVPSGDWLSRYDRALDRLGPEHLEIMQGTPSPEAYDACNLRLLELAHQMSAHVVLLGLLDGDTLQERGGSAHFARRVRDGGGRVDVIDVKALRGRLAG